jgi:hypothetical protein
MSTTGVPLNLTEPATGTTNWGATVNANWVAINSEFASINNAIAALQAGASTQGPVGPKGLQYAGGWLSSTAYAIDNVVMFNGSSYVAIAASTNAEPDLTPNTWEPLALGGAAGPPGPTGPQGPAGSGGGTTVTFPITLLEGGTGVAAANPAAARTALGAAASGVNADITRLAALVADTSPDATSAIAITAPGGNGNALTVSNGVSAGGIRCDGSALFTSLQMSGGLLCGSVQISGNLAVGAIYSPVAGGSVVVGNPLIAANTLTVAGATPTAPAGQIAFGTTLVASANPGNIATLPATVLGFLVVNIGGDAVKIPYYA